MAGECCQLVGALDLGLDGCFISVSTNCSTEIGAICGDDPVEGPTIGTVNLSAYMGEELWVGCPSKAGVSIPFIRKYDCENDRLYFIFNGKGQSFYNGDADQFVSLHTVLPTSCTSINASSGSGPASIYNVSTQINGYGMSYDSGPINFSTDAKGTAIELGGIFSGPVYYLQNFSLDLQPGQLPTVSYSLVFSPNGGIA
jgi:hypothetical protein